MLPHDGTNSSCNSATIAFPFESWKRPHPQPLSHRERGVRGVHVSFENAIHPPENRCPDCLYLKLEGKTVGKEGLFAPIQNRIDFALDVNFNEQWEPMPAGRIKFGLTGGELRLKLENGSITYELRELKSKFELAIPKERQQKASQDSKEGAEASLEVNPLKIAKTAIKGLLERKFTI